jgi:putative peptide zinc metalloprotease protein
VKARLLREIPGGDRTLPSPALGAALGGEVEVSADDRNGTTATRRVFQFELELPLHGTETYAGRRLHARFEHGRESVWRQLYRATRQVFLERLAI